MNQSEKKHRILFSGGGTGGSVAPLLAIYEGLSNPLDPPLQGGQNAPLPRGGAGGLEFLWLGTKNGPERRMVENVGLNFKAIPGGKWRRYFSLKNFLDILKIKLAFWQAFFIMLKWRPDLVMSAGSFSSVPVVWAAWFLSVPIVIHQQDVRPGLANKLMAPLAKIVTVTFEKSLKDYGKKAVWTGNPVRGQLKIKNYELLIHDFKINKNLPVILILGGGTGAMAINELVAKSLEELTKFCQTIHVTGKNKSFNVMLEGARNERPIASQKDPIALRQPADRSRMTNYNVFEFLNAGEMAAALKLAEVVVSRAGMGALTELSYFAKPSIIIPLPDSHQEENAEMFNEAAIILEQKNLIKEKFVAEIKALLENKELQKKLSENIGRVMKPGANEMMRKIVLDLLK